MESADRKFLFTGLIGFVFLAAVNYLASTPFRFAAAIIGLFPLLYAVRKLRKDFGVPLFYYRSEGPNYWSGALGGLIALLFSMYGSIQGWENISLLRFTSDLAIAMICLLLVGVLLTGAVLKDVKEGYVELEDGE